jgi:predicted nucleic acid-binding protein
MPIDWQAASEYDDHREEAEKRIADRDLDDWPTVALALKLPVWTQDKDHTDARIEIFTTADLLDALRDTGHDPDLA